MSQQVEMNVSAIGGLIQTQFSGNVRAPANGMVTVDSRDAASLLAAGGNYVRKASASQSVSAPIAGAVGQIVASTTLANGTLSIANQPDVGRLCSVRIFTGTAAVTAGNVALNYVAMDGTTTTDNFSTVGVGTMVLSTNASKGILHMNSAIVTGVVTSGTTAAIQIDTLNALGCLVDPNYGDFTLDFASIDGTFNGGSTVNAAAACVTPSTAPNGTHNYVFNYSYSAALG